MVGWSVVGWLVTGAASVRSFGCGSFVTTVRNRTYVCLLSSSHLFCHLFPLYFLCIKQRSSSRMSPSHVSAEERTRRSSHLKRDDDGFRRSIVACFRLLPSAPSALALCRNLRWTAPRLTLTLIILCLHITYTISKMMRLFAFFALIASASAFVPPQQAGKLK